MKDVYSSVVVGINDFSEKNLTKFLIFPCLGVIVPSIILAYYSIDPVKSHIKAQAEFLGQWLDNHVISQLINLVTIIKMATRDALYVTR